MTTLALLLLIVGCRGDFLTGIRWVRTESGLRYRDLELGTGPLAQPGLVVSVHYSGFLMDGTRFDDSYQHGVPFQFQLGSGQVIAGFDEGIPGMAVGGKRDLLIPPELAYGSNGAGGVIPPNATLRFRVELVEVRRSNSSPTRIQTAPLPRAVAPVLH